MFLPNHFSFEAMSAVGNGAVSEYFLCALSDNADSELALYPTALTVFGISAVSNSTDSRISTFEYEYLRKFETEFENILGCESGAHTGSIHEKNLMLLSLSMALAWFRIGLESCNWILLKPPGNFYSLPMGNQ
jgi:hypothetical protein